MGNQIAAHAPPMLCLIGPSASGKSLAALSLAQHFELEIISMDSALVYRGMDIGTAKPSLNERVSVPHHLIDILDPTQAYSAATFVREVQSLLPCIEARKRRPLLVGGTLLYYQALAHGLSCLPSADPLLRAELKAQAERTGWPAMHARLALDDPETAARVEPNDAQRIQRALEVIVLTGQPMSHLLRQRVKPAVRALHPISLEPERREVLHQGIVQRLDQMLAGGFIEEVEALRARYDLHCDLPAMRCVGYRQVWQYLEGAIDRETMRERTIIATRQLVKRQLTWLRRIAKREIIACDQADFLHKILSAARRILC